SQKRRQKGHFYCGSCAFFVANRTVLRLAASLGRARTGVLTKQGDQSALARARGRNGISYVRRTDPSNKAMRNLFLRTVMLKNVFCAKPSKKKSATKCR